MEVKNKGNKPGKPKYADLVDPATPPKDKCLERSNAETSFGHLGEGRRIQPAKVRRIL